MSDRPAGRMPDGGVPEGGFVPGRFQLDSYGRGGFRFGGLSHRGSILVLPAGIAGWSVSRIADLRVHDLLPVFDPGVTLDFFLLGTGPDLARVPDAVRARFREAGISFDAMQTGPAARTYNVLVAEDRRVGAALLAVP